MSAPAFTPGPWMRDGISVTTCAPVGKLRRTIAIVGPDIKLSVSESQRRMIADAGLIAKAPELYEALGDLEQLIRNVAPEYAESTVASNARIILAEARDAQ